MKKNIFYLALGFLLIASTFGQEPIADKEKSETPETETRTEKTDEASIISTEFQAQSATKKNSNDDATSETPAPPSVEIFVPSDEFLKDNSADFPADI